MIFTIVFNGTIDFVGSCRFIQEARAHLADYRTKILKIQDFDTNLFLNVVFVSEFEFGVERSLRCIFSNLNFMMFCIFMFFRF